MIQCAPRPQCNTLRRTRVDGTRSVQKLVSPLRVVELSSARSRFPRGRRVARNWHRLWLAPLVVSEKMCCRSRVSHAEADSC